LGAEPPSYLIVGCQNWKVFVSWRYDFWDIVDKGSEREQKLAASLPVRRLGTPKDVSNALLYFCDPANGFVTGQTLYVCGGASIGGVTI